MKNTNKIIDAVCQTCLEFGKIGLYTLGAIIVILALKWWSLALVASLLLINILFNFTRKEQGGQANRKD